jgi:hypothetical protein
LQNDPVCQCHKIKAGSKFTVVGNLGGRGRGGGPWGFGLILLRGYLELSENLGMVPFCMFYCIFMRQFPPPMCIHESDRHSQTILRNRRSRFSPGLTFYKLKVWNLNHGNELWLCTTERDFIFVDKKNT